MKMKAHIRGDGVVKELTSIFSFPHLDPFLQVRKSFVRR